MKLNLTYLTMFNYQNLYYGNAGDSLYSHNGLPGPMLQNLFRSYQADKKNKKKKKVLIILASLKQSFFLPELHNLEKFLFGLILSIGQVYFLTYLNDIILANLFFDLIVFILANVLGHLVAGFVTIFRKCEKKSFAILVPQFSTFDVDNDNRAGDFAERSCARLYKVDFFRHSSNAPC